MPSPLALLAAQALYSIPTAYTLMTAGTTLARKPLRGNRLHATAVLFSIVDRSLELILGPSVLRLVLTLTAQSLAFGLGGRIKPLKAVGLALFVTACLGLGEAFTLGGFALLHLDAEKAMASTPGLILGGLACLIPLWAYLGAAKWSARPESYGLRGAVHGDIVVRMSTGVLMLTGLTMMAWKVFSLIVHDPRGFRIAPDPIDTLYVGIALAAVGISLLAARARAVETARKLEVERRLTARLRESLAQLERAQSELVDAEKYKVMAQMAGGIAHSFNNILTTLRIRAQLLLVRADAGPFAQETAAKLIQGLDDAAAQVNAVRAISRDVPDQLAPLNLSGMIRELADLRTAPEASMELTAVIEPDCFIIGDRAQLADAIDNVVNNAIDAVLAVPPGDGPSSGCGHSAVAHPAATSRRRAVDIRLSRAPGGTLALSISDTGMGVAPDAVEKVFLPFFTTKAVGSGMGLGLAIARGVIRRHHGDITMQSIVGEGTTVLVTLPEAPDARLAVEQAAPTSSMELQADLTGLRVLVIDDNTDAAEALCEYLRGCGCECSCVTDSAAIAAMVSAPPETDVVVTDLSMPGANGLEVATAMRATGAPVILVTGWARMVDEAALASHGVSVMVPKPYDPAVLARHIARLVGAQGT